MADMSPLPAELCTSLASFVSLSWLRWPYLYSEWQACLRERFRRPHRAVPKAADLEIVPESPGERHSHRYLVTVDLEAEFLWTAGLFLEVCWCCVRCRSTCDGWRQRRWRGRGAPRGNAWGRSSRRPRQHDDWRHCSCVFRILFTAPLQHAPLHSPFFSVWWQRHTAGQTDLSIYNIPMT